MIDPVAIARECGAMNTRALRVGSEILVGSTFTFDADQLRAYTERVLGIAARLCDEADKSTHPADLADAIRALLQASDGGSKP